MIKKGHSSNNYPEEFVNDNCTIKGDKNIANGFNKFFVNVGPSLASKIKTPETGSIYQYLGIENDSNMSLDCTNIDEIIKTVKDFKGKQSTDSNDINMYIVKKIVNSIADPLCFICNKSFTEGVFPDDMKTAKVKPLFKSGERNVFTNYRPVSLLPQFSKILEKLFYNRLASFVETNSLLSEGQYGFRRNRGTNHALLELVEKITNATENKKVTVGVFVDLKKAFDTIDHSILIKKLMHYGVRTNSIKWIESYLNHRTQYVKFNNSCSDQMKMLCGVPQGSILGPLLFILYINDICNVSNVLEFILFADDTNIFCSGNDIITLRRVVNDELKKLNTWFDFNKLSLNVKKTNYMIFTSRVVQNELELYINNEKIEKVQSTKFLGVVIDDKLNWKEHIARVKGKLSKCIAIMHKVKYVLNSTTLLIIYNSLFLPYLSYCLEIWGNTYKSNVNPLYILQKKCIRVVAKSTYRAHTSPLFYMFNIIKLYDLINLKTCIIMYKVFNNTLPDNIIQLFDLKFNSRYDTRNSNNIRQKYARTNLKSQCISVNGIILYNKLNKSLKNCSSVKIFSKQYKKQLLENYVL